MTTTANLPKPAKIPPSDPRHPEHGAYLTWLRGLSMKERGELIAALCREAAEAEQTRIAAGLPPTPKEPFPESTLELFRNQIRKRRERLRPEQTEATHE
jgi:hypothetical protein